MSSFLAKKSGILSFGIVLAIGLGLTIVSQSSQPDVILATSPSSLYKSYYFSDGGTSGNSSYSKTNITTTVSYASDNPGGKNLPRTTWEADYANLSYTYGTFLGGKLVSTVQTNDTTPWANIKTKFCLDLSIDVVTIRDCEYFGTKSKLKNLYLQSSSDTVTWVTVKTLSVPSGLKLNNKKVGDGINIVFNGFTIAANSYLRFGIGLTASSTNSGLEFNGIAFNSYTLC